MAIRIHSGSEKNRARLRRAGRASAIIAKGSRPKIRIHRTLNHIYAWLMTPKGDKTMAEVSTQSKVLASEVKRGVARKAAAAAVGREIAKKALDLGIKEVAFDRAGYNYNEVVRALANAAREAGLEF